MSDGPVCRPVATEKDLVAVALQRADDVSLARATEAAIPRLLVEEDLELARLEADFLLTDGQ